MTFGEQNTFPKGYTSENLQRPLQSLIVHWSGGEESICCISDGWEKWNQRRNTDNPQSG